MIVVTLALTIIFAWVAGYALGYLVGLAKEHKLQAKEEQSQASRNEIVGEAIDKLYQPKEPPKATMISADDPVLAMKYETEEMHRKLNPHIPGNENEK